MNPGKYLGVRFQWEAMYELLRLPPRQCKKILSAVFTYHKDMSPPDFCGNKDDEIAFSVVQRGCDPWVIE